MNCPYCQSKLTTQLKRTTSLGYAIFRCNSCKRDYNERTATPFNRIEVPTDIVFEVPLCRVRYKLSYRDVAEYFLYRGFEFTHETVRDWEERFLPLGSLKQPNNSAKPLMRCVTFSDLEAE